MKLRLRLFLSFLAVIILIPLFLPIGAPILVKNYLINLRENDLNNKGREIIRSIREWQEGKMSYWQFGRLVNNLDYLLNSRIWIVDNEGFVFMASTENLTPQSEQVGRTITPPPIKPPALPENTGTELTPPQKEILKKNRIPLTDIPGGAKVLAIFDDPTEKKSFFYFHPYYNEEMLMVLVPYQPTFTNPGGLIIFHLPAASIDRILRAIYMYLSIPVGLAMLLALLLANVLSKSIARPLLRMKSSASEMAKGNYDVKIALDGPEELQELAMSFNSLAADLETTMKHRDKQEQLRRDFVANISHELRTPLTIMRGFTEALLDGVVENPDQIKTTYQTMRDETIRLSSLITELLDLSRLESSSTHIPIYPMNLAEAIQNTAFLLEQPCLAKEVNLEIDLPEENKLIFGNGDRLTQLFLILLDNALKFTPTGGTIRIRLENLPIGQLLSISDTGSGISPEDLPHIWERFYKSDKSRQRTTGQISIGLGLPIAKEILDRHCATVEINSELGIGTTFKITFPDNCSDPLGNKTKI